MPNLFQRSNSVNRQSSRPVVIWVALRGGCWVCEKHLPADPPAVVVKSELPAPFADRTGVGRNRCAELIYVVCSQECCRVMQDEMAPFGVDSQNRSAADALLGRGGDIAALVEGWMAANRPWFLIHEAKAPADDAALRRFLGLGVMQ